MTTKTNANEESILTDGLIAVTIPLDEINRLDSIGSPLWRLTKKMDFKISELENYCRFLQIEVQKLHEQEREFGKALNDLKKIVKKDE